MRVFVSRRHYWLGLSLALSQPVWAQLAHPGTAPARGPDAPRPTPSATPTPGSVAGEAPIVPDAEFNAALPPLSGDISAPLEPMPATPSSPATPLPSAPATATPVAAGDALPPVAPEDPQLAAPLTPIAGFDTTPLATVVDQQDRNAPQVRYDTEIVGLRAVGLEAQWKSLSALRSGGGRAGNGVQVQARATEDEALAIRLLKSLGYYDATAVSAVEANPPVPGTPVRYKARVTATPGRLYTLSSVTLQAGPVTPSDLLTSNFALRVGDPIEAARVQGAEANLLLVAPQKGYPFLTVGQRDVLLDDQSAASSVGATGAYTLPIETGPRARFGRLVTAGDPVFGLDHLNVFPRFHEGQLYDSQLTDDLRDALVATGLYSSLAVEPQRTGRVNPDGTEAVDLLVRQSKGPARSLNGNLGYSTGQGFRLEGNWTHRNLFPPEGALIASVIAGTQEQGISGTFRRSNAGRRDRTFTAIAAIDHSSYDAFNANTGTLSARWSYDSTPIWQKRITYYYGGELTGTNESVYSFSARDRVRRTYAIVALPGQIQWDTSDSLLNPTRGHRLRLNVSPETSVHGGVHPYARTMIEGTIYRSVSPSLVLAGRARAGSILGIGRDDLAPSRRYYGGGGGSVRGYGFQRLGPFDPNGDPIGGRSLVEFAGEARYRFGNFGIVPFVDAGNSYEGVTPGLSGLRLGAGIGGRFYTNFGPFRIDAATPLNPRKGDSKLALYISIGQAF
ncbi:BamA/TamA family outer membrane protein [Sphingomonas sp.]|uniref:autotransporter assembly complex protein TamA n=1 Tax=Sphingomonas sp. TaxID=28214 RepID=UPI003CC5FFD2